MEGWIIVQFIKGFTFAPFARRGSYTKKEAYKSLDNLKERVGINFIILVPNGLQETPQSEAICHTSNSTVSDEELEDLVYYAKKIGIRVELKLINHFSLQKLDACPQKVLQQFQITGAFRVR